MKTKYIIPNEAIEDFKNSIDMAIMAYELIKKDVSTKSSRNKGLSSNLLGAMRNGNLKDKQMNPVLIVLNGFIKELNDLKTKVGHINTKKVVCPNLVMFLGFMEFKNPLSNAIVVKVMQDSLHDRRFEETLSLRDKEKFAESYELQEMICKLLDGYYIPKEGSSLINVSYLGILGNASYFSKLMVEWIVTKETIKDGMTILVNRVGLSNMDSWDNFIDNYNTKYRNELTKEIVTETEKEYKKGTTLMYTETKELEYYIKGGVVKHLCAPRTFLELLKRNNYSLNARSSLEKQMQNALMMASLKENNDLIGAYLGSIDIRYQEMWAYLVENADSLKQVSLEDIRKNFYLVPEIGEGYGYTKEDFDYFMIDSLVSNYHLAKNHNKALRLIREGKINVNFEKSGKKFKKIA